MADADLDDIWWYVARNSGSAELAGRLIDSITDRFYLLSKHPNLGRLRPDLRAGLRTFAVGQYLILYRVEGEDDVLILRVLHGKRDAGGLPGR